jgi:hypothetical protein
MKAQVSFTNIWRATPEPQGEVVGLLVFENGKRDSCPLPPIPLKHVDRVLHAMMITPHPGGHIAYAAIVQHPIDPSLAAYVEEQRRRVNAHEVPVDPTGTTIGVSFHTLSHNDN